MESTTFNIISLLNYDGKKELIKNGYIKSSFNKLLNLENNITIDDYFNLLISLSEYSFISFNESLEFNYIFNYDHINIINYKNIYNYLTNNLITSPIYNEYCIKHKNVQNNIICLDCLEKYRILTRNIIPIIKELRKDLCSIYFIDILYDLIRFENRELYTLITFLINNHKDGSSFKLNVKAYGKNKLKNLFKLINRPFRQVDFRFILKKYIPLIYNIYLYCDKKYIDYKDKIYDYMLNNSLSLFKIIPSKYVLVGYKLKNNYILDIIKTKDVRDFWNGKFKIASYGLLEELNFGFYKERQRVYTEILTLNNQEKIKLKNIYTNLNFSGQSVFTGNILYSTDFITIGFLKKSGNTFQNFRLDIHIDTIITNNKKLNYLKYIEHNKWI